MLYPDFAEFIAALNRRDVRYLIVGAHAVALHARPRATKALDVLLDPELSNAERAIGAIGDFFGGADLGYTASEVADPDWVLQLGTAPVRIDLLSQMDGATDFGDLWDRRTTARFGDQPAHYISLDDLILVKTASNRTQDRADVQHLRKARARKP